MSKGTYSVTWPAGFGEATEKASTLEELIEKRPHEVQAFGFQYRGKSYYTRPEKMTLEQKQLIDKAIDEERAQRAQRIEQMSKQNYDFFDAIHKAIAKSLCDDEKDAECTIGHHETCQCVGCRIERGEK